MDTLVQSPPASSKAATVTGWIITALVTLFLLMDGVMKIVKPKFVVEKTVELGYAEAVILPLGVVLTLSSLLYAIPRTAVLGAILLTGYLGGAVDANLHARQGPFPLCFAIVTGLLVWLGLFLREPRVRALVPLA